MIGANACRGFYQHVDTLDRAQVGHGADAPNPFHEFSTPLAELEKRLETLAKSGDQLASLFPRPGINFPHAFANTQIFLDWDNVGTKFDYPIVPIAVNCYGEHVIARRGGIARFAGTL